MSGTLAIARALARSAVETRATAAELRIIAYDLCLRAQAERGRARLLALGADMSATAEADGHLSPGLAAGWLTPSRTLAWKAYG